MNNLICSKQHGFRSGRCCLTQLLHHFDDDLESLANNSDFDSIYLDYTKAFDKVDHKLLIRKLALDGIHPKVINWIESFLSNRKQAVVVDGHLSLLAAIISGVPQGTVLGPILFLIFIKTSKTALCTPLSDALLMTQESQSQLDQKRMSNYSNVTLKMSSNGQIGTTWRYTKTSLSTCVTSSINSTSS